MKNFFKEMSNRNKALLSAATGSILLWACLTSCGQKPKAVECTPTEVKTEVKEAAPPLTPEQKLANAAPFFAAIKRTFSDATKVCYDFTLEKFLVQLDKSDEEQKQFWGWNIVSNYKFETLENKTMVFKSGNWENVSADVTGLTCSN